MSLFDEHNEPEHDVSPCAHACVCVCLACPSPRCVEPCSVGHDTSCVCGGLQAVVMAELNLSLPLDEWGRDQDHQRPHYVSLTKLQRSHIKKVPCPVASG